jgi:hypothetical protein
VLLLEKAQEQAGQVLLPKLEDGLVRLAVEAVLVQVAPVLPFELLARRAALLTDDDALDFAVENSIPLAQTSPGSVVLESRIRRFQIGDV